jgi:hypothetical protein
MPMGRTRTRRRAAVAVAPLALSAVAVAASTTGANAAPARQTDAFTFTSDGTGESVTCTIEGSYESTPRSSGGWALTAFVRISEATSPECFDGVAHLTVHEDGGDEEYIGGGSFVQVETVTATEVTRISYDLYFNACACYSDRYHNPK